MDAGNMLKPALARGELHAIGATTVNEYRKHIEKDPALERRFQPVQGSAGTLAHYFGMIADFANSVGVATPLMDCVVPLYERCVEMGLGDKDVAAMVDVISALPRSKQ